MARDGKAFFYVARFFAVGCQNSSRNIKLVKTFFFQGYKSTIAREPLKKEEISQKYMRFLVSTETSQQRYFYLFLSLFF